MAATEIPKIRVGVGLEGFDRELVMDLRWRVLREPWGQPRGSETDGLDDGALHAVATLPNGRVVGVGRIHRRSATVGQVRFMAVEEGWRGQGTGSRILRGLEEAAARRGFRRLVLEARSDAESFYRRHGYEVVGDGKILFGAIRHVSMAKETPHDW